MRNGPDGAERAWNNAPTPLLSQERQAYLARFLLCTTTTSTHSSSRDSSKPSWCSSAPQRQTRCSLGSSKVVVTSGRCSGNFARRPFFCVLRGIGVLDLDVARHPGLLSDALSVGNQVGKEKMQLMRVPRGQAGQLALLGARSENHARIDGEVVLERRDLFVALFNERDQRVNVARQPAVSSLRHHAHGYVIPSAKCLRLLPFSKSIPSSSIESSARLMIAFSPLWALQQLERSTLQPFVVQLKSVLVPKEQFDPVTTLVEEDENRAIERVLLESSRVRSPRDRHELCGNRLAASRRRSAFAPGGLARR